MTKTTTTGQADRVSFTYGIKVPGPVQFSSITISASFSTDLVEEETPEDAIKRARDFVMREVEKDYDATREDEKEAVPKKKRK